MTVYAVNPEDLQAVLVATLGEQVLHIAISRAELCLDVRAADLLEVAQTLRDAPGCQF
ncbi:MAG: NADH-quinone oxidoreductase subunit C, partial [Betaproteobacteria bacterium]|nr:NADH-quinone oxidoreductase subunit C [Betaproteobacteria bacterium]